MRFKRNLLTIITFLFVMACGFCFGTQSKAADAAMIENVMNVKCQVTQGTTADTEEAVNMRLVTTIDSLDYAEVGFEIYYNGSTEPIIARTSTVYERIVASAKSGIDYNYNPKAFSTDSEYFATVTLLNIAPNNFGKAFYIKTYCKTLENETIYGVSRYVKVSDSYNDIVNIQVKSSATQANGMQVEYDTEKMTQLTGYDHDGTYAHLVFQVNDGETLSSVTSFVAKDAESNAIDKVLYRNLTTKYTGEGTADRSWYDTNTTATEFMIATPADLYGLVEVAKTYNFNNKTIYLGADIIVNTGDSSSWTSTNAPDYNWNTPIGGYSTMFGGTFDGNGDTISGLYTYSNVANVGLFGKLSIYAKIKNLRLENSYFESTHVDGRVGSIAGHCDVMNFDSIYSNAKVVCTAGYDIGGLAGRVNSNATHTTTNCWFDGTVLGYRRTAGLVGGLIQGTWNVTNCLNTGIVSSDYVSGGLQVGGFCGQTMNSASINFTKCLNAGEIQVDYGVCVGSIIGYTDSTNQVLKFVDTYSTNKFTTPSGVTVGKKVDGVGNNSVGTYEGTVSIVAEADITGINAFNLSLDYVDTWVATASAFPELKQFATANVMPCDTSWYDAASATKEYEITTVAELYGLAVLSQKNTFAGWTIKLGDDITINTGDADTWATTAPKYMWLPIGNASYSFDATFDGQGHSIKGVYLKTDEVRVGFFGQINQGVVKNFALKNSYIESTATGDAPVGGIAGYAIKTTLDTVYSDAIVNAPNATNVGGLVGRSNENVAHSMINCWFAGTVIGYKQVGGLGGSIIQGSITATNCLFSGTSYPTLVNAGVSGAAMFGCGMNSAQFIFTNCMNAGTLKVDYGVCVGTYVGRLEGAGQKATFNNSYSIEKFEVPSGVTVGKKVDGIGNNSAGTVVGTLNVIPENYLKGYFGYQLTGFDFVNTWVAKANGTPELKAFSTGASLPITSDVIVADTSWYDASTTTQTIADEADFYGWTKLAMTKTSFAGKDIVLSADIDLNPGWKSTDAAPINKWIPIGHISGTGFTGNFDGQGHVISGLYVDTDAAHVGLFGEVGQSNDTYIKNFIMRDSSFNNHGGTIGAVAGFAWVNISDVYVEESVRVTSDWIMVGGIAGSFGSTTARTIENCWFDGYVKCTYPLRIQACGGIVGRTNMGTKTIKNCLSTGTIVGEFTEGAGTIRVGGIIGEVYNGLANATTVVTIDSCLVNADITVNHQFGAGSVAGCLASGTVTIKDTYTTNNIKNVKNNNSIPAYNSAASLGIGNGSDATFNTDGVTIVAENDLIGVKGYTNTKLGFYIKGQAESDTDVWVARANDVPTIKTFVPESEWLDLTNVVRPVIIGTADTSWEGTGTQADPYLISTPEELYGFAEVSATNNFSGQYIKLANDIVLNTGDAKDYATTAPRNAWKQISLSNAFAGTFDGDGHTISGLYLVSAEQRVALFGATAVGSMVKNLRIENSYLECTIPNMGNAITGSIAGKADGNFDTIYSNAIVVSSGYNTGGLFGWVGTSGERTYQNCWFDGSVTSSAGHIGGILGHADLGPITFKNCLNTGTITSTITMATSGNMGGYVGGLIGHLAGGASPVTLEDCLNTGNVITSSTVRSATLIGCSRANMVFINTYTLNTITNINNETISFSNGMNPGVGTHSSNEGPTWSGKPFLVTADEITGANAYRNLEFDFWTKEGDTGAWVTTNAGYPVLKSFVDESEWNKDVDLNIPQVHTEWYDKNTSATTFTIRTAADLYGLSELVNAGNTFSGKTIQIASDVDSIVFNEGRTGANRLSWTPIGTGSIAFYGTFDGNGKTISGLYAKTGTANLGLFGNVSGTIQNLRLTDSYFEYTGVNTAFTGSIAGFSAGTMTNVYSSAEVVSSGPEVGGLVGRFGGTATRTMSNCWFDGAVTGNQNYVGGLVGQVNMGVKTISNCLNTGTVTSTKTSNNFPHIGGFVGGVCYTKPNASTSATTLHLQDCLNAGPVVSIGTSTVGAIVGRFNNDAGTPYGTVSNVYYTPESYSLAVSTNSQGKIEGTTTTIADAHFIQLEESYVTGANAVAWTTLDFDNIWAARAGKVPAIRALLGTEVALDTSDIVPADTSWYDESATTYTLADEGDLRGFALMANLTNFYTKKVVVDGKITLDRNIQWIPIGQRLYFRGTFGGASASEIATISGVNVKTDNPYIGLFAYTWDGSKIQNLKLIDSSFECTKAGYGISVSMGSIVGQGRSDLENVYSNATLIGHGNDIGGLVGRLNNSQHTALGEGETLSMKHMTTKTLTNCWFDGTITSDKQYVGGLVANLVQGGVAFTDCLYTGTMTLTFDDITVGETEYSLTRAGGILGYAQNSWTKVTMDGVISAGTIKNTTGNLGVGTIIGRSTENEGLYLTNVYAIPGQFYGTNSTTINGTVTEVQPDDRLIGYIDYLNGSGLDFDNTWTLRKSGAPAPKVLVPAEDVYVYEDSALALTGWGNTNATLKNAKDMGVSNYVMTLSDTTGYYKTYENSLVSAGFTKEIDNTTDANALASKGVYNAVYTKADGGVNWVVNVTHAGNTKNESYISVNTGKTASEALSAHMTQNNDIAYTANDGYTTAGLDVKLVMREMYSWGNSFIIQLPNGHFIINDGGTADDMKYLVDDLYAMTDGKKPIIEAWTISHLHMDHTNVFQGFAENKEWADKIYVEAIYLNEPGAEAIALESAITTLIGRERRGVLLLKSTSGNLPNMYRMQTGQRFYFDGVTIDVVQAQEQIPVASYVDFSLIAAEVDHGKFNCTSTGLMFTMDDGTTNGKKVYIGGDQTKINMDWIMAAYDASLFTDVNVFTAFHHGSNTLDTFTEWSTNNYVHKFDVVLLPAAGVYNPSTSLVNTSAIEHYTYKNGNVTLTFTGSGIRSSVGEPNSWKYNPIEE